MVELFAFGTFWFWALLATEIVLLLIFSEYDNGIAASLSLVGFLAALYFFGDIDVIALSKDHPWRVVSVVLAYLGLGVGWAVFEWKRLLGQLVEIVEDKFKGFASDVAPVGGVPVQKPSELTAEEKLRWKSEISHVLYDGRYYNLNYPPKVSAHKAALTRWASMWTFYVILFFFRNLLWGTWRAIINAISGMLQRMADDTWKSKGWD